MLKLKKNSFIEGTIIATLAIVLVKILGIIYVIPFYATVGATGAALYGYAYTIYGLFLEIATIGIPSAVSKLINEFNTLNKQEAKIRTFKIGKRILSIIALIAFLIMFIFAKNIAALIHIPGGSSISDIAFVIRCVSFAILIFPYLSVSRGFFSGHNVITVSSISQIIEQLARVIVIIGGSYIALNWLHLSIREAIGVAVFGAFIGGLFAFLYVLKKLHQNKKELNLDKKFTKKDAITNKEIIKKIIKYAVPTIIISIAFTIYNNIDMILILKVTSFLGFSASDSEFIATGISTWATKIFVIVTSVGLGMSASLIPNMVEAFTLKNYQDVNHKFNKAMEIMIFISLPMCLGICLLSAPIWSLFYGYNPLGTSILAVGIFAPLFTNFFSIANYTLQSMNKFKVVYLASTLGIVLNTILDAPFMLLVNKIGLPAYWGATFATAFGLGTTVIIAMIILKKDYNFKYQEIWTVFKKCLIPLVAMVFVVVILKILIPVDFTSRMSNILYIGIITIIGALVYFLISYKMELLNIVLGNDFLAKIKKKFKKN